MQSGWFFLVKAELGISPEISGHQQMTKAANTRTQGLQWGILLATQSEMKETELLAFQCEQTGEQQVYFHPNVVL